MGGPTPLPENAPPTSFSAARALTFEREILGGDVPHPVGTAAHDAVRDRLAAQFRALGYDVTIQRTFACSAFVTCSPVANVIARTPGDARPDALVLAAHYDSVPAGPGVSDDGVGVGALLETARRFATNTSAIRSSTSSPMPRRSRCWGRKGLWPIRSLLRNTAAVINVEARGTSGPSFLFETSRHNAWLANVIAHALPRPATSSLYYDIYELLPNDTDLTVFKRAGLAGHRLRAHRPSGSLPLAARQLRQRRRRRRCSITAITCWRWRARWPVRSSPDAAAATRSGSTCCRSS